MDEIFRNVLRLQMLAPILMGFTAIFLGFAFQHSFFFGMAAGFMVIGGLNSAVFLLATRGKG
jgi:hypothetical protein